MNKKRSQASTQIQSALNSVRADEKRRRREDYIAERSTKRQPAAAAAGGGAVGGLLDALPDSAGSDTARVGAQGSASARGARSTTAASAGSATGGYDAASGEWVWDLKSDMRLRVTKFKGNTYVDIRKTWNGNPTQKGVCIPIEIFRSLQRWEGLDDAVKDVEGKK